MLEQDQAKSKDAIKDMHDGLQVLNTIVEASVEASKTAGDLVIELRITAMINTSTRFSRKVLGITRQKESQSTGELRSFQGEGMK